MANEKTGKDAGTGPFQLGRSYEEVGPELGCLHEARHVVTGRAALTLLPESAPNGNPRDPGGTISSPLPPQPFRNQAKAPCKTKVGEVEINGGCWVALEQRPPCYENRAEYQGKCYLPVSKDRGGLPQSVEP